MRTLWKLIEHERGKFFAALGLFVVMHSPVWILPLMTANIIDVVVDRLPLRVLWINAAIFAVLLAQNIPLHYVYARFLSQMIRSVELRLRSALVERFQFLSMDYYKRASADILQSKMVRDVETIEQMLRQFFDSGAAAVSNMLGALVIVGIRRPNFLEKVEKMAAHRLSTIVRADRIPVLDGCEIIESGRYQELMRCDGWYRNQFEAQAVV